MKLNNGWREVETGPGHGLVVTDLALKLIAFDRGAAAILNGSSAASEELASSFHLPPEILNAFGGLRAADMSIVRTHFRKGSTTYSCRAYLVEPQNGALGHPMVAFFLRRAPVVDYAIEAVASEYGLTEREQQVLRGISTGLTSKELAVELDISPHTVKTFLRQIMGKMELTTRSGVVGKLLCYIE